MKRLCLICGLVAVIGLWPLITSCLAKEKLPRLLVIGSMPAGMLVGVQATGISNVLSRNSGMKVTVKSVTSEEVWTPMLISEEVDLGVAVSLTMYNAYKGLGVYGEIAKKVGVKGFPVRLVTVGTPIRIGLLVQGAKHYEKISDLKGATIVWFPKDTAFDLYTRALLANGGLDENDVKKYPQANPAEAVRSVMEGKADACMVAVDAPAVAEAVAAVAARWLPANVEPEAVKKMQSVISTAYVATCPGGQHVGVPKDQQFMHLDIYLVANAKVSDAAAYAVTKVLWEHNAELTQRPMLKEWVTGNFVSKRARVPYHPGAFRFYQEMGICDKDMKELQEKLLAEKP